MTRTGWRRLLVLTCSLLALGGCGDLKEPVVGEATPEPMQTAIDDRCEDADEALVERVAGRLDVSAELRHAQVVASEDEEGLRFLAAALVGDELDPEPPIGTWALLGHDDPPEIYAVDAIARAESSWPDGTRTHHDLTMKVDGGEEAATCASAAAK